MKQFDVDIEDVEYLRHGDAPLLARLYKPRGVGPFPMMVDVHGGGWTKQDRLRNRGMNEPLAKSGVVVAALDFRMPPVAGYPASMQDINYGIRWLKSRAAELRGRPDWVGGVGVSSGGHQVMLTALRPNDARYAALPLREAGGADASLRCAILLRSVIDPLARYHYAKRLRESPPYPDFVDGTLQGHDEFWGSEAAMADGNPTAIVERGERVPLPPVLCLQGALDELHPRVDTDRFVAAYRAAGGSIELVLYEGEGIGSGDFKQPAYDASIAKLTAFVHQVAG